MRIESFETFHSEFVNVRMSSTNSLCIEKYSRNKEWTTRNRASQREQKRSKNRDTPKTKFTNGTFPFVEHFTVISLNFNPFLPISGIYNGNSIKYNSKPNIIVRKKSTIFILVRENIISVWFWIWISVQDKNLEILGKAIKWWRKSGFSVSISLFSFEIHEFYCETKI